MNNNIFFDLFNIGVIWNIWYNANENKRKKSMRTLLPDITGSDKTLYVRCQRPRRCLFSSSADGHGQRRSFPHTA